MDPFKRYLPALEDEMRRVVTPGEESPSLLYGMLHYHLGWADAEFQPYDADAGKKLRPVFLLLAVEAQGGVWERGLPAAASVELLHNFSLIHDDIEDRDVTRRGRPTLWTLWGEAQAINAGDALFALAYSALHRLRDRGVPPDLVLKAWERYNATVLQLTEGQCLDLTFESMAQVDEETYLRMVRGKTSALVGLACELGGLIAAASSHRVVALREFGLNLGLSFQMQDDLLGLWGDPERTGKPVGADLRQRKKTLPILHGLAHSPEFVELLSRPTLDEEAIAEGQALLEAAGSRTYTEERAEEYHDRALEALARAEGGGEAQKVLRGLAHRLLGRQK
jgi:geranylgeranyl diphosphate synthase type I